MICIHLVQLISLPPHHLLLHYNPDWLNLSGADLPRLSWKEAIKWEFFYIYCCTTFDPVSIISMFHMSKPNYQTDCSISTVL